MQKIIYVHGIFCWNSPIYAEICFYHNGFGSHFRGIQFCTSIFHIRCKHPCFIKNLFTFLSKLQNIFQLLTVHKCNVILACHSFQHFIMFSNVLKSHQIHTGLPPSKEGVIVRNIDGGAEAFKICPSRRAVFFILSIVFYLFSRNSSLCVQGTGHSS